MQFKKSENKVKFTYFNHDNGIFFDEKRKRFVDFKDMDQTTYFNYNSPFRTVSLNILIYLYTFTYLKCSTDLIFLGTKALNWTWMYFLWHILF